MAKRILFISFQKVKFGLVGNKNTRKFKDKYLQGFKNLAGYS